MSAQSFALACFNRTFAILPDEPILASITYKEPRKQRPRYPSPGHSLPLPPNLRKWLRLGIS
jgi:hypothetical protein